jgi:hypothetical protein
VELFVGILTFTRFIPVPSFFLIGAEPDEEEKKKIATPLKGLSDGGIDKEWVPFWEPQAVEPDQISM